jgi:hypothetical protein
VSGRRRLKRALVKNPPDIRELASAVPELTAENTKTAAIFARIFLKFVAKDYQEELLEDPSKRIAVIWPR